MWYCFFSLGIFAGVTLTGIGSTWLLDETNDKSLELLSREQQREFIRGALISRTLSVLTFDHLAGVPPVELRHGVVHQHGFP
jgi:hypothetical protein